MSSCCLHSVSVKTRCGKEYTRMQFKCICPRKKRICSRSSSISSFCCKIYSRQTNKNKYFGFLEFIKTKGKSKISISRSRVQVHAPVSSWLDESEQDTSKWSSNSCMGDTTFFVVLCSTHWIKEGTSCLVLWWTDDGDNDGKETKETFSSNK